MRCNDESTHGTMIATNLRVHPFTKKALKQLLNNVHIERIGFGIPMGGSLEFLDPLTISKALENRKRL